MNYRVEYYRRKLAKSMIFTLTYMLVLFLNPHGLKAQLSQGEHRAELSKGSIWYYVVGNEENTPMLMLHGGPGGTGTSLFALSPLSDDYCLIVLDQPGTGRSTYIADTSKMTMSNFTGQLKEFVDYLGLEEYIIYGHSWGTMLGLDFYLEYPEGVQAMVMNSPLVSSELWMKDAKYLISTLHDSIQDAVARNEEAKTYNTPEYKHAMYVYSKHFIGRNGRNVDLSAFPPRVAGNRVMYNYMWGPSEFNATGTLKTYDRLDRLDELDLPVLWITGEYDEARPETVEYYHSLDKGSEFAIVEGAAHGTMFDNQEANVRVIREFLYKLDQ